MKQYTLTLTTTLCCLTIFLTNTTKLYAASEANKTSKRKDKLELETLKIQGNKELPKILFVVPWQNKKLKKGTKNKQRLVLHSLYGDLFDPVKPEFFIENQK